MVTIDAGNSLTTGLALADLSVRDLWVAYFGLGGNYPYDSLVSYLAGEVVWNAHEHDVAALALNEYCMDHGLDHPVRYSPDL